MTTRVILGYLVCALLLSIYSINASEDIIKVLKKVNCDNETDLIILARGGGSLEDLQPFNNEKVVRQIFNSKIPLITAIGHETDITLSDFVSSFSTSTPSEAAEICAPSLEELKDKWTEIITSVTNLRTSVGMVLEYCTPLEFVGKNAKCTSHYSY